MHTTLGIEQEYLPGQDRALFDARPDLVMTGRTVFGHSPAKGQQLDDVLFRLDSAPRARLYAGV